MTTTHRGRIYAAGVGKKMMVWRDPAKPPVAYPLPAGAVRGEAYAVNPRGDVGGVVYDAKGEPTSVVWRGGRPAILPGRTTNPKHPRIFWAQAILDDGLLLGSVGESFHYGSELWASDGMSLMQVIGDRIRYPVGTREKIRYPFAGPQVSKDGQTVFTSFLVEGRPQDTQRWGLLRRVDTSER